MGESPSPPSRAQRLTSGLAERQRRHRERHLVVRVLVVVAGLAVLAAGVALIVLPGPAIVVIPAGLALLALEFSWAERLLAGSVARLERTRRRRREPDRR